MRILRPWIGAAAVAICLCVGASAGRADTSLAYKVQITAGNDEVNDQFRAVSRLIQAEDMPPAGIAGLDQRAQTDKGTFLKILRSHGYYDGDVTVTIDDSKSPVPVTLHVELGSRYSLGTCRITYSAPPPAKAPMDCKDIGLEIGEPARAEPIITATQKLVQLLQEHGRPDAKVTNREAIVNHLTHKMELTFNTNPGREARFGHVVIMGAPDTDHHFLARIVPWKQGETYDVRKLDEYRQRLANLNLFDSLVVKPDTAHENEAGLAPIAVDTHERRTHSIGLGARYATDTGPGLQAKWEDRNLWGRAEDLNASLQLGTISQSAEIILTLPHEPNTGQTVGFDFKMERDTTDAYDKTGITGLAQITTPLGGHWTGKGGISAEAADIKQSGHSAFSVLASFPVGTTYDNTKSLLDPKSGERLALQAQPVVGTSGGTRAFLIFQSNASAYRSLDAEKKLIAAARVRLGTILFTPEQGVPADLRFYSGGGGSVRGYAYQHVGPRDAANNPIGGRAVAEASFELRYHAWQDIGLVGFVDAGTVSVSPYFANAAAPRVGAGIGLRYYTSFGPLRLDVGTPLNPQPGDAPVQVYISLGQAF